MKKITIAFALTLLTFAASAQKQPTQKDSVRVNDTLLGLLNRCVQQKSQLPNDWETVLNYICPRGSVEPHVKYAHEENPNHLQSYGYLHPFTEELVHKISIKFSKITKVRTVWNQREIGAIYVWGK